MARAMHIFSARLAGAACAVLACGQAQAACPIELAVYEEAETKAGLSFVPAVSEAEPSVHKFRIAFAENGVMLDGVVMQTDGLSRPYGMAMHNCPQGDATGAELDACTIWQGVIYAVDGLGNVDLLPPEGADAPKTLLLPDFARAVRMSAVWGAKGLSKAPWEVFTLSGCQE